MGVVLNLFDVMEMIGIAFPSPISGAMVGIRKQLDFFGVLILGIVTAVGGGVLRDVIIGVTPRVMFRNPSYTVVASITAAIFFASRIRKRLYRRHHPVRPGPVRHRHHRHGHLRGQRHPGRHELFGVV